ncbi:hypothetical protein [Bacillus carboniphilus]
MKNSAKRYKEIVKSRKI